jgi:hypothetical protein
MKNRIPLKLLPQTLSDIFRIVRLLNFRYIWIDTLCIVQNGPELDVENAKMGDVYANASLVVAATASESAHDGLFLETRKTYPPEHKAEFQHIMHTCRTMTQREWQGSIRKALPLLSRGWAFQDRLLARRTVHFTQMELVWECHHDRWCVKMEMEASMMRFKEKSTI